MRNFDELHSRLLEEATRILSGDEHNSFSLDAVATRSGVSKGGVLHHFPTKEALCRAIIEESAKAWLTLFDSLIQVIPTHEKGRWSKAYIGMSFTKDERTIRYAIAAERLLVKHPELISTYLSFFPELKPDIPGDGLAEGIFDVIVAACDGMWLRQINGWSSAIQIPDVALERTLRRLAE